MMENVRKGILIGLGAATFAEKEIEKQVKVLVKNKKITASQGKKLAGKFLNEGVKTQARLRKLVDAELDKIAKS
jgi:polyhydroxyalkanoate synthesis regulator phasin